MPIALTPEQAQLSAAVAQFAARHAPVDHTRGTAEAVARGELPQWWKPLTDNGFHAVHLPEERGGQGGELADLACVIESASTALLSGPLLPTVTASAVVLLAQPTPETGALLEQLAAGLTAAVVLPDHSTIRAVPGASGWLLEGTSGLTAGLTAAGVVVVAAHGPDGATLWFALDAATVAGNVATHQGTDLTVDVAELTLAGLEISKDVQLSGIDTERARCVVVALVAAATAGITHWCVDAITHHLRTREQFGKPIGTFQALQHKAAMLLVASELATAAAWDAVRAADEPLTQHQIAAASAAVTAVAPVPELVLDTLTMFGAIGFTWEHDLHLYWRRAISLAASVGPASSWSRRLGEITRAQARDLSVNLGDADADFRAGVAQMLDRASRLRNDGPGRQGDYDHFMTGPQRTLLAEEGLIAPHWPKPFGLDATPLQQLIINEEFERRGDLVRPSVGIAEWILPTLLSAAPVELQQRFIPATLRGELAWCQLFSEPGAGSDLAALATRATKVDGGWLVNGHKIWTSAAHRADYGALLARTDPAATKHRGIGYFVVDMTSAGIDVHPIRQASGDTDFNEVFLDDVFVPDAMLLGDATGGWGLAIATMASERAAISGYVHNDRAGALRWLASNPGPGRDAAVCALGEVDGYSNAIKALATMETIRLLEGQPAGAASSIAKVATSEMLRRTFEATLKLTGPLGMVTDTDPPVVQPYLRLPAELVGGGTREIQLNIIAQMIMGLPRK